MVQEDNPDKVSGITSCHVTNIYMQLGGKDCSNIFSPTQICSGKSFRYFCVAILVVIYNNCLLCT